MLAWLGSEEEPWQGPRVRLYLVLDDNQVVLSPDQEDIIDAFTDLCVVPLAAGRVCAAVPRDMGRPAAAEGSQVAATHGGE